MKILTHLTMPTIGHIIKIHYTLAEVHTVLCLLHSYISLYVFRYMKVAVHSNNSL